MRTHQGEARMAAEPAQLHRAADALADAADAGDDIKHRDEDYQQPDQKSFHRRGSFRGKGCCGWIEGLPVQRAFILPFRKKAAGFYACCLKGCSSLCDKGAIVVGAAEGFGLTAGDAVDLHVFAAFKCRICDRASSRDPDLPDGRIPEGVFADADAGGRDVQLIQLQINVDMLRGIKFGQ